MRIVIVAKDVPEGRSIGTERQQFDALRTSFAKGVTRSRAMRVLRGGRAGAEHVTDLVGQNPTDRSAVQVRPTCRPAGSSLDGLGVSIAFNVTVKHP